MEQDQPPLELLQGWRWHRQPDPAGLGIGVDLDEVDAPERGAQLVLDTRLPAQALDLDAMRGMRHLERRPRMARAQRVERADECDRYGGRRPRRAPGRHVRGDADLQGDAVGSPD